MGIFTNRQNLDDRLTILERRVSELMDQRQLPILELDDRMMKLERTLSAVIEEVEARVERGNKVWRQIRARERREEKLAEESEFSDDDQEVLDLDGAGGPAEGVRGVPPHLATPEPTLQPHEEAARAIARAVAQKGIM